MKKRRVLIIEDHVVTRKNLGRVLEDEGYDVILAEDAETALSLLTTVLPDLVITDLILPRQDGLEVLLRVKEVLPSVPVIVCTAHVTEETWQELYRHGAISCVEKPFTFEMLLDRVRHAFLVPVSV